MTSTIGKPVSFVDAIAVTRTGPRNVGASRTFRLSTARIAPGGGIRGRPNGGYLMAIAARAAIAATGRPHPHAVTGTFLRTPAAGLVDIEVETVKAGRQLAQARCSLIQDGSVV